MSFIIYKTTVAAKTRSLLLYSSIRTLAMKPGTPIPGLDIFKEGDPIVALERSEYPEWIEKLTKPQLSLAKLRRMEEKDATLREMHRYVKLTRRLDIKKANEERAK